MLAQSILKTLLYFDIFDYPLTSFEVWKWLWQPEGKINMADVVSALGELAEDGRIEKTGPFWHLPRRQGIIETRHWRHRLSIAKINLARRFAHWCSIFPTVEGVAICNSLGYRNASAESDIDLLVLARPGYLWLTRFLVTGLAQLLGRRPTNAHSADTICLSFYLTTDNLNLQSLQKNGGDPYLIFWLAQLTPLLGRGEVWREFWQANDWLLSKFPHALPYLSQPAWLYKNKKINRRTSQNQRKKSWLESAARYLQLKHLPAALKNKVSQGGSDVVISDSILKFHLNDRRTIYRELWQERCRNLGISV